MKTYFLLFLIVLIVLLPYNPAWRQVISGDSDIFLYTGQGILDGQVPYRDVFANKGPLVYYLDALGLAITPGSRWGVWLIELFFLSASAFLGFALMEEIFGKKAAFFGSALFLVSLVMVLDGGNLTEEYSLLFQFSALYLFWQSEKSGWSSWRNFLMGTIAALSFLLRPNLIGVPLTIAVFLLWRGFSKRRLLDSIKSLGQIFIGAASVLFLALLYFYHLKALNQMISHLFIFNFFYSFSTWSAKLKSAFMGGWILARSGLTFVTIIAWVMALFYPPKEKRHPLITLGLIGFPLEVFLVAFSGNHSPHYYLAWLPIMSLLAAFLAHFLIVHLPRRSNLGNVFLAGLLLAMSLPPLGVLTYQFFSPKQPWLCRDIGWFLYPASFYFECHDTRVKVRDYVQKSSKPNDYVLVWQYSSGLNFYLQRRSPIKEVGQAGLFLPGYQDEDRTKEFLQEIKKNQPTLIIDASSPFYHLPPINELKRKEKYPRSIPPEIVAFFAYVTDHYRVVTVLGEDQWEIYQKI